MSSVEQQARHSVPLEPMLQRAFEEEWLALRRVAPIARAGLAAARIVALAAAAENAALPDWYAPMADALPPATARLARIWAAIGQGAPAEPDDIGVIRNLWALLAPTDRIMETGGDIRLQVDPRTRLNGYGASHKPRPWAITYASTTASSISERGYEAADAVRRATTAAMLCSGERSPIGRRLSIIQSRIKHLYEMPRESAVILAASGTDTELLALALAHCAAPDMPVLSILIAPEETGSGVPMAAAGRHFAVDTASGQAVMRATPVAGFRTDTELAAIALRDKAGTIRPIAEVEAEIEEALAGGIASARHVVLHALDLSKTGLLAPRPSLLRKLRERFGTSFDIVVDACQLRLSRASIRHYLALDATVLITGSKFLTGPPFSGALLLPPHVAARLARGSLPVGLAAYFGRDEFPHLCRAADFLPRTGNYGLALRWTAALAEYAAVLRVPEARRSAIVAAFGNAVIEALAETPSARLLRHEARHRGPHERPWERLRTVFGFALRAPFADRWLDPGEARAVYRWLNADLSPTLPGAPRPLAARICHVGQPVPLPQFDNLPGQMGVLRLACGARLISGEPSHSGLSPTARLEREFDDVHTVFRKIRLILENWNDLAAADPKPRYRSGAS